MRRRNKKIVIVSISCLILACCVAKIPTPQDLAVADTPYNGATIDKMDVSEDFAQGSEDVPLLVGMEKIFDESVGFDSESGSIMSSSYTSKISLKKIKNFYSKTLVQMGWHQVIATRKN